MAEEGGHWAGRWAPCGVGHRQSALSWGCDSGRCLGRESGAELCFLREGPPLPAWRQLPGGTGRSPADQHPRGPGAPRQEGAADA